MTTTHAIAAFIAAAIVLSVTPGLDTAMVLRTVAAGGPRRGMLAAIGINLGCSVWGSAASVGLGALLAASGMAYAALKWAGAGYLAYSGVRLLLRPREQFGQAGEPAVQGRGWQPLLQGFLTNILNPKVGVFYITFLPQFIPAGASVIPFSLMLTAMQVAINVSWFALLIALSVPLGRFLRRAGTMKVLDRLTGGLFVAFGARLALSR